MKLKSATICALALAVTALAPAEAAFKVGITLPSQNQTVWYDQGLQMKQQLEGKGFEVELFYGGDGGKADVPMQVRQIERMVSEGCQVLVLTPIDATSFTEALAAAKKKGVTVIAYDRLIMDSPDVDYYVCFNNLMTGRMMGQFIVRELGLDQGAGGKTMEIFQGDPGTSSAPYFYKGAMEELQPYIDAGQLTVPSGQTKFEHVTTPGWSRDLAFKRMDEIIEKVGYKPGSKPLDAVLSASDNMSRGAADALLRHGFTKNNIPVITGQDCSKAIISYLKDGLVKMSVLKNGKEEVERLVTMVSQIAAGQTVEYNDTTTYNNGAMDMKSMMCTPVLVTADNWHEMIVDRYHLFTDAELQE